MTHYNINYTSLSPLDKFNKAIADCIDYLGQEKFEELCDKVPKTMTLDIFRMALSFAGIQGYPAKAMWIYATQIKEKVTS